MHRRGARSGQGDRLLTRLWGLGLGIAWIVFAVYAWTTWPRDETPLGGLELPPIVVDADPFLEGVVTRLKVEEGLVLIPYDDTLGNPTIGYGTLLPLTDMEWAYLGSDRDPADGITEPEADWLLRERLRQHEDEFRARWTPYEAQPRGVQAALLDAMYQLGVEGLLAFGGTLGALEAGDYETAAQHVEASLWASETPARAAQVADAFRAAT